MDSILVRAKFHRPPPPPATIARPHLLKYLHNGTHCKLTLVSAPAGFGKSTIVSAWLDQLEVGPPPRKVAWLGLEEADNHLPRFVQYVVAAIEEKHPQSCATVLPLLYDRDSVTIEALTNVLVNDLMQLPGQLILVLDDLHLINDNAIYVFLTRLIQLASSHLHLVLITRVDPPLPLNRWRARGQLNELRIHELAFTHEETEVFLKENLEKVPNGATIAALHHLTEGWVVGLRLVVLALRGVTDYAAFVSDLRANSNRYVIDYLVDDVLDQLPPSIQQVLGGTAILTRFSPALCAAVLEIDESTARQHIAEMARANLFLIELSTPPQWYRYHHQFQSMLLSRLHERYDPQAIAALHRRAALWLADQNQVEDALRHMLAIPDFVAAADLIESQRVRALNEQRFQELDEWLTMLPTHLLNQRPLLLVTLAWVQNYWLNNAMSLATLKRAEALLHEQVTTLPETTQILLQAEILALHIIQSPPRDRPEAIASIRQDWAQIRQHLAFTHWNTVVTISHSTYFLGEKELAQEILRTTIEQATEWSPMARSRLLYSLGILYWYDCNLVQADRIFQESLHLARQHNLYVAMTLAYFGLGLVSSERNQQEQAETYQLAVIQEPHYQNGLRAVFSAYHLMTMYAASGQPEKGQSVVEQLKADALRVGRSYLINQVDALQAYLALLCGDLTTAWRWALAASRNEISRAEDRAPLIRVQILMAKGSSASLDEASQILHELSERHESESRWSLWIETLILESLTWAALNRIDLAIVLLGKVVLRAVPNGIFGPFVVRGKAMEQLLRELGQQSQYSQYVQLLLTAFPVEQESAAPAGAEQGYRERSNGERNIRSAASSRLPEPLTEREQEVLALLVGRLSNKEIAQLLVVSPNTVRNHTANIFGKLQVENRMQAVARARSLGILPSIE